jgi:hypothetical protein
VRGTKTKTWWVMTESNRRHPACKAGALPTELITRTSEEAAIKPDGTFIGKYFCAKILLLRINFSFQMKYSWAECWQKILLRCRWAYASLKQNISLK